VEKTHLIAPHGAARSSDRLLGPFGQRKKAGSQVFAIATAASWSNHVSLIIGLKGWFGGAKSSGAAAGGSEAAGGAAAAELPADAGEGGEFDPDADDSEDDS